MPFNPFSALTAKIFGSISIVALIGLAVLGLQLRHVTAQRDALFEWQGGVVQATRDASRRPRLAHEQVALQVRYLGQGLDQMRSAVDRARADALATKLAADTRNEAKRRAADNALVDQNERDLRAGADYLRTHRVHDGLRGAAAAGGPVRGDDGRGDLPSPGTAAKIADRPDSSAELVAIPRTDFDNCTVIRGRLVNAAEWAAGRGQ